MQIRAHLWTALAALVSVACPLLNYAAPAARQRPPTVTWSFETRTDRDLTPHSRVFLRVNGRRVPVYGETTATFQTLGRGEYTGHGVPSNAITACAGWFAGQGEDLYVVRRGRRLVIYLRELDEQAPIPAYKRLKSVPAY